MFSNTKAIQISPIVRTPIVYSPFTQDDTTASSINPPTEDVFELLSGENFLLLSGQQFDLLG